MNESKKTDNIILEACKKGISDWTTAFNNQDALGCAMQYQENCIMTARPFGVFEGRDAIQAFWQDIIDKGFDTVDYTEVDWQPEGENGYTLTSRWTMNKAFGVVHNELWIVGEDGLAKLASDEFEIQGER
ncbi:nuclear transport factor 2 family protein [Psychromonas sp. Urea-02u-13]|uniref:nuclear transport factor 2 family protein n=1 Tax=Psychromonas sp. Urea-02u-13 TaxID=2058326 RepID=UPI000C31EF72|nr:nuclear transport factor 2 family protein [Psychromonas sp. Urea-02u-13]PKG37207.1 isochorismatase [Psychromonas sp. Urea-02u-13]